MSHSLVSQVESLLFVAGKPLLFKDIASQLQVKPKEVEAAVAELNARYEGQESGLRCIVAGKKVQMFTAPEYDDLVREYLKAESTSELTRPSVETLAIITYRGPLSKEELEYIRGVNCTLILRNLMIRGLVEEQKTQQGIEYMVTHDFVRHLGVASVEQLPEYETLRHQEQVEQLIEQVATDSSES